MEKWISIHRPSIKRKDLENVLNSMIEEKLHYGDFAKKFEKRLSRRTTINHVLAVNSFYSALNLVLSALNVEEGDEVILPAYAPQVYLNVILARKAVPVLVDLEKSSLKPSLESIKKVVSRQTKAIFLIYYFGYVFDPEPYYEIFPNIVEDITSVIGIKDEELPIGKKCIFAVSDFSLNNLITTGDGAAIYCNIKTNFSTVKSLIEIDYFSEDYYPRIACLMPDLNAAMGVSQDETLKRRLELRSQIGEIYNEAVTRSRGASLLKTDVETRLYSYFPIKLKTAPNQIMNFFKENNIEVKRPFAYPLHHYLQQPKNDFPETENLYLYTLLIPIYSTLLKKDVDHISKAVASIV